MLRDQSTDQIPSPHPPYPYPVNQRSCFRLELHLLNLTPTRTPPRNITWAYSQSFNMKQRKPVSLHLGYEIDRSTPFACLQYAKNKQSTYHVANKQVLYPPATRTIYEPRTPECLAEVGGPDKRIPEYYGQVSGYPSLFVLILFADGKCSSSSRESKYHPKTGTMVPFPPGRLCYPEGSYYM